MKFSSLLVAVAIAIASSHFAEAHDVRVGDREQHRERSHAESHVRDYSDIRTGSKGVIDESRGKPGKREHHVNPPGTGAGCTNLAGWTDSFGDGCDWYASDETGCQDFATDVGTDGLTPSEACCVCQGTSSGTDAGGCTNLAGWTDSFGDGCEWYEANEGGCQDFATDQGTDGNTPADACCHCDGGSSVTSIDDDSLDTGCTLVEGWTDQYGDTCEWYERNDHKGCPLYGSEVGTNGTTVAEACCICLGDGCELIEGFTDSYGDKCSWYEIHDEVGCPEYGDVTDASGVVTARDACCHCASTAAPISETSWPSGLYHRAQAANSPFQTQFPLPVTTSEATSAGWSKSAEACVPKLGEPWLYQGKRDIDSSVTLYFSPQVGDEAGVLTGIEVDYYGAIPETLIGSYFSEKRGDESDASSYHSVAVGLRDSNKFDLCDESTPLSTGDEKYVIIAPTMTSVVVPSSESAPELVESFQEGSCIQGMGFHWLKSTVPNQTTLDYKAGTTVPVVAMYHPETKDIAGIFFWAPQRMQNWDNQCTTAMVTQDVPTIVQCMEMMNFWDPGPGLSQETQGRLFMCSNTCDEDCYFEDSVDGILQTMHFFFYPAEELICPGSGLAYCRNGVDLFAAANGGR